MSKLMVGKAIMIISGVWIFLAIIFQIFSDTIWEVSPSSVGGPVRFHRDCFDNCLVDHNWNRLDRWKVKQESTPQKLMRS